MDLMTMIVICSAVFIVVGVALFFILSKFNVLRRYALFIALFVTVCMILSLFYVRSGVLPPEFSIVPAQPAEFRGFPLSMLTTATLNGQTTTHWSGWKSANEFSNGAFYFFIALIFVGLYGFIKRLTKKEP